MISTSQQKNAIQQNNAAASLVAAGEYNTAIQEFSFALKTYRQVMIEADDEIPQPVKTNLNQCMVQSGLALAECRKEACRVIDNDQKYYMYQQAIRIPLDIDSTYQASVTVSSVIIFNVALAHHLSALATSDKKHQSKKLCKATTLYEMAYDLQGRNAQLENNVMFTMAAMNNLGVIYLQLEDRETASKCFQCLLSTIMFLVDCGAAKVCCDEDLDGFLRNVTNLVSGSSFTAATA
jgi:tetratricopeptide (TPR) repeat protein